LHQPHDLIERELRLIVMDASLNAAAVASNMGVGDADVRLD
jgi:hypothetical protein